MIKCIITAKRYLNIQSLFSKLFFKFILETQFCIQVLHYEHLFHDMLAFDSGHEEQKD